MITVVAARALPDMKVEGDIYLRTGRVLDLPSVHALDMTVRRTFDKELDDFGLDSVGRIVDALSQAAASSAATFVVPGAGSPGDAVVAALPAELIASIHAVVPERSGFAGGSCRFIDAVELATAELNSPFDRGLAAVDPTVPLIVSNWYGERVTALASARLLRIYGDIALPQPTGDGELVIEPIAHLSPAASLAELEQVVARLRRPDGCPWDRDQTRESLFPQFVEELQELGAAIEAADVDNQREELGDVLFHVIAQCQLASEAGDFSLDDVLRGITAKLVRRHPHVFGDVVAETYDDVLNTWQRVKAEEKSRAGRENSK